MHEPNTREAALAYAKLGYHVIALHNLIERDGELVCSCAKAVECTSAGKHPRTSGGVRDATTDPNKINEWFRRWPFSNIGLCPQGSEFVLDVDPRNGGDVETLAEMAGEELNTLVVWTGGGGVHAWFRAPPGVQIKNSTSKLAPGFDIKTAGGYVVAPPSGHLSGNKYDWLQGRSPHELAIADAPASLIRRIEEATGRRAKAGSKNGDLDEAKIAEGGRNSALTSEAGKLRRIGLDQDAIEAALQKINESICDPPLSEDEVARIAASVARYEPADDIVEKVRQKESLKQTCDEIVTRAVNDPGAPFEIAALTALDALRRLDRAQWQRVRADLKKAKVSLKDLEPALRQVSRRPDLDAADKVVIDPDAPLDTAKEFVARRFTQDGHNTLHYWKGQYYRWRGTSYTPMSADDVRKELYDFLDACVVFADDGLTKFNPNQSAVKDVEDALRAATQISIDVEQPFWIGGADLDAQNLIACSNGMLDISTRELLEHTPEFFNLNALRYPFEREAPSPEKWLKFLHELWPDDSAAIDTLQEFFGYALTGDTSQQKMFLIIGPKRSGKGTIGRVLGELLGEANVVAPTLGALTTGFGLAPLIHKRLAIIADARLGGRTDQQAVVERLLSVSGEDHQTIDRKYLSAWTGKLGVRFMIMSNELPRLGDASGALAARFILLKLTHSFYGHENPRLTEDLRAELPSILRWSLDGLERLRSRGYFVQPASGAGELEQLEELSSPVQAFIAECCVKGASERVAKHMLYGSWSQWCRANGHEPSSIQTFGRNLRAAVSSVGEFRPRTGTRQRLYTGISLSPDAPRGPHGPWSG